MKFSAVIVFALVASLIVLLGNSGVVSALATPSSKKCVPKSKSTSSAASTSAAPTSVAPISVALTSAVSASAAQTSPAVVSDAATTTEDTVSSSVEPISSTTTSPSPVATTAAWLGSTGPVGWGKNATGGKGASPENVYTVTTYDELKSVLKKNPGQPRIVYIEGTLDAGLKDGRSLTDNDYSPGYNFTAYLQCFTDNGKTKINSTECNTLDQLRIAGVAVQTEQILITIPSDTSILGLGSTAKIVGGSLRLNGTSNVIIQNIEFEAPRDYFTEWDPTDGSSGAWNAEYDAVQLFYSNTVWVDHCTFSDGANVDDVQPKPFADTHVQYHDGLLDVTFQSDLISISNTRFENHDKCHLFGNSDSYTDDTGHIRVTLYGNVWNKAVQRTARVRFGRVHLFNNYWFGDYSKNATYRHQGYYGNGYKSEIYSERNAYDIVSTSSTPSSTLIITSRNGNKFFDKESFFNGASIDLIAVAKERFETAKATAISNAEKAGTTPAEWTNYNFTVNDWNPSQFYPYEAKLTSYEDIKASALANAGVGKFSSA